MILGPVSYTHLSVTVVTKACPLFVPLVEEGLIDDRITEDMVSRYLREFKQYDIDSLILGCTHYPLLINPIQRFVGDKVTLVNPAYEVAKDVYKRQAMWCGETECEEAIKDETTATTRCMPFEQEHLSCLLYTSA